MEMFRVGQSMKRGSGVQQQDGEDNLLLTLTCAPITL